MYDRFVTYEGAATLAMFGCPEGVEYSDETEEICREYDYADVVDFLETVPGVTSVGRITAAIVGVAPDGGPDEQTVNLLQFAIDESAVPALGSPIIVDGRLSNPAAANEVVINEQAAAQNDVGVGDALTITPYRRDEFEVAGQGNEPAGGDPMSMTITGIVRRPGDLAARLASESIVDDTSSITPTPAWWDAVDGDVAIYGIGLAIGATPGTSNDDIIGAVRQKWPDRELQFDAGAVAAGDGQQTVVDAISLQAVGLGVVGIVVAIAAFVFVGQAISRQTRSEWHDGDVLAAIGMTKRVMVSAALLRAIAFAALAAPVAALVAVMMSPLGPIGIGRAAEPDPGLILDGPVFVVGLPLVALAVLGFAVGPIATRRLGASETALPTSRTIAVLPPTGVAGWAMTTTRRAGGVALGSAVVGVALATAAGVAAWSLVASYDDLVATPSAYGADWDAQVGNVGSPRQEVETQARLAAIPGIRAVGILSSSGIAESDAATLVAGQPFLGDVAFGTIIDGRAPLVASEVALGRQTMDMLDVGLDGTATIGDPSDPSHSFELEVVGVAVLNNGLAAEPGDGLLLTPDGFERLAPGNRSQNYAVWIDGDVDRVATLGALPRRVPDDL